MLSQFSPLISALISILFLFHPTSIYLYVAQVFRPRSIGLASLRHIERSCLPGSNCSFKPFLHPQSACSIPKHIFSKRPRAMWAMPRAETTHVSILQPLEIVKIRLERLRPG
ncbi:transmembrane protein, putative [Rhizoctonia solani AG-3 Rhs1AP]|uniref:Transmembrane protein, putative n=2 Tax=Rhizoctonia solani AG-3 TaxID=1086053 RepID=X8J2H0_9AGAM|nr:transmembrane protein, putative [Rhizoctonia solani AG-3 Rhs1AP]KEP46669.1 putative transmembrane protein [Rhizoctonia solani 123E]